MHLEFLMDWKMQDLENNRQNWDISADEELLSWFSGPAFWGDS